MIGGGPAGLYCSLLLKQSRPDADITVLERNRPDDAFGWGVVFSDQTLENFRAADPISFERITASFAHYYKTEIRLGYLLFTNEISSTRAIVLGVLPPNLTTELVLIKTTSRCFELFHRAANSSRVYNTFP